MTQHEAIKLPTTIEIPSGLYHQPDEVADYLSDEYGFCIYGLEVMKKGKKTYATNIRWDTSE